MHKQKRKFIASIGIVVMVMGFNHPVLADDGLRNCLSLIEKKVDANKISSSEDLVIGGGATFVMQGTIDANSTEKKGEDVTDGTFSIDLELEKSVEEKGTVFIHLEAGNGSGLDGDEITTFSGVNADATGGDGTASIIEAWYEYAVSDYFSITTGKIDATCYLDDNVLANNECEQFLGAAFKNSTAIDFPDDNGLGVRFVITPNDQVEMNAGIMEADGDFEDVADDVFAFGQINLMPQLMGKEGNYRVYGWLNNKPHVSLIDSAKANETNYGFGLSCDQFLTDHVAGFLRFGYQQAEVSVIEYAWSVGMQLSGGLWKRENDFFGMAFGQNMPSDDYGRSGEPDDTETHLEIYYNYFVNDVLSISPDFQIILNPNGVGESTAGRDDTIYVLGVRAQIGF